jgi:hypothetical protein
MAILGRDADIEHSEGFKRSPGRVSECIIPGENSGCESGISELVGGRNDSKGRNVTTRSNATV